MERLESTPKIQEKEYLNPGVPAIMASLGEGNIKGLPEGLKLTNDGIEYVNIDADPSENMEDGFSGEYLKPNWAYMMSPIDSAIKFSTRYVDCTGVAVVGTDKETGKNISFLTHQNPAYFTYDSVNFLKDLGDRLQEIKERCEQGTIDAVLFGGKFSNVKEFADQPYHPIHDLDKKRYLSSIKIVTAAIETGLGFSPTVISGPKINPAREQVIFDTHERRLFLERIVIGENDPAFIRNFDAKDVDGVTSELPKGEWPLPGAIKKHLGI
jgi:hypothetical protein